MGSSMNQLNFELLPTLETGSMFAALDPDLDSRLKAFPATYDRAMGALALSARMCSTPVSGDGSDVKLREAYCRAALGEFVSMEESFFYDDPHGGFRKIVKSRNPLLHILKQLRNMQFHVLTSSLACEEHGVIWADQESTMKFWFLQDISIEDFDRIRDARRYAAVDKESMVSWFNSNQRKWGVNQLILEAVSAYASENVIA